MKGNKLIIAILIASICLQVGTLISVKSTKEEKNETKTEETTKSLFGYDSGKYISVAYNENEFVLFSIKDDNYEIDENGKKVSLPATIVESTKKITDDKIISVKVMNSPLASDESEAGIVVTESGKSYVAFEDSGYGFYFQEFHQLKDYKVKEVLSIEDSSEGYSIKVILQDGSTKVVTD